MNQIEIYSNKKKAFWLLMASLLFVIAGFYIFIYADDISKSTDKNSLLLKIVGIVGVGFFSLGIYVSIKQLIKSKLILIIDKKGINVNPKREDYIKWDDIKGFSEIKINSVKIMIIQVINPDKYLENETNIIRKKLMQFNLNNYNSPFNISVATMNINYEELFRILNQNLIEYKTKV